MSATYPQSAACPPWLGAVDFTASSWHLSCSSLAQVVPLTMALTLSSVAQLSRDVVDERFPDVFLAGVLSGTGDSNRVEVILTVAGDNQHRLMLNLTRVDPAAFERELEGKLGCALAALPR